MEVIGSARYFTSDEFAHIEMILRGAYLIRTADGEEDELLGDFIEALVEDDEIVRDDSDRNELDLGQFPQV